MTPYLVVHDAFLTKILEDEWEDWLLQDAEQDWRQLMEGAIIWFKFPRISLDRDEFGFVNDLTNNEIQIIANFMKCEWLARCIASWENIRPLYDERDFSPANMLEKLRQMLAAEREHAAKAESIYYRSVNGRPFNYSVLGVN